MHNNCTKQTFIASILLEELTMTMEKPFRFILNEYFISLNEKKHRNDCVYECKIWNRDSNI